MNSRSLVSLVDLSSQEIEEILSLALDMKADPDQYRDCLQGKVLAMVFQKPSLRTRVSFETGMRHLGGHAIYLAPADIDLGRRESVPDVARTLGRMVNGIMARTFQHDTVVQLAECAGVPVINGLTDLFHPCQALADMLTLREVKGRLEGLRLAFVGDGNNVCHSLMAAGARLGVSILAVVPPGYEPRPEIVNPARRLAQKKRSVIEVVHSLEEGVAAADAVYTDVWTSMGQEPQAERRLKDFASFQVDRRIFAMAKPDAVFMHCLPAHRGEEVSAEVCDSPRSVIFQQAENRLHAQKAVLALLLAGAPQGRQAV
ncbi:MAG: ornithine carbamoyltransferase [Acidobacteriota bacterium]